MGIFKDKVVVVSGSTRGIGRAIAWHFCALGASVVINGRDQNRVARVVSEFLADGGKASGMPGDIGQFEDSRRLIDHAISTFGKLDYVINNAGVSMEGDVADLAPEVFQKVIETNLVGSCYLTKAAIDQLKKTKGGVVFVSSCASFVGIPGYSIYCASKMAMEGFAESLKLELESSGVFVGIAQVGFTENDLEKKILGTNGQLVPQPARQFVRPDSQESVAAQIAMMIRTRKHRHVFSSMGKIASLLSRFAPGLYERILRRHYRKSHQEVFMAPLDCNDGLPSPDVS